MEKAKRDIERLKQKLSSADAFGLSWEAKEILKMYAQGYHDWCAPQYRENWRVSYREAVKQYGAEFASQTGPSEKTLYWMVFMIQFRGGKDSEEASKSLTKFWLLARRIAPENTRKLIIESPDDKEGEEFLASLDESLKEVYRDEEEEDKVVNT